ncbi:recombinase family protein [Methylomonas sp. TEB]|uniref:recombinase family protein n=1 Tax=Methylomonas sp. TEB TaxID=3398229 RepID=UPI0039F5692E
MPKAFSYIRFSSTKQQTGDSVARQVRLSEEYAAKNGLELDADLNMRDLGISAYDRSNLEKGALGHFLRLVEEKRIPVGSYLLVESLDRLSRDKVMDALSIFTAILRAGIVIVTLSDNQVYSYEKANDNWASLIVSIAIMSRANEESAVKSQRVRSSWDAKRLNASQKRLTRRCPYWLKPTDEKSGFEFIPERLEVVKRIFQMSLDGIGVATIVKTFNQEGVPTFSKKASGWQNSYIMKVLHSPAIYGDIHLQLQRDGETTPYKVIHDYYPKVMTKEEWLLVASARASRRTQGGVKKGKVLSNLFSGLLRCGYCGGPMNMGGYREDRKGKHKRLKYIFCSKARRGLGCRFIQWTYPDFEAMVLRFCKEIDFAQVIGIQQTSDDEINRAKLRLEEIKLETIDIQQRNETLLNILERAGDGSTLETLLARMRTNENMLSALESEKKQIEIEVIRLTNSRVDAAVQQNLILELMERLEKLEGNDLHLLRIRLSEAIKRVIARINTFPGGKWFSEEAISEIKNDLIQHYDHAQIEEILATLNRAPNKKDRSMLIVFKNGVHRQVSSSGKVYEQETSPPFKSGQATSLERWILRGFRCTPMPNKPIE